MANRVGPFGGVLAAQMRNAVLQHPKRLGAPVALTVNFAAPLENGAFDVVARPARTNRSTQHWVVEMLQRGQTVLTGSTFTAQRRATWGADDLPMPSAAPAADMPRVQCGDATVEWIKRDEMRFVEGGFPSEWNGAEGASRTLLWLRDGPPRALDFTSLAALADAFFPRIWRRRAKMVPIGTVSMSTCFHAGAAQLAVVETGRLLGEARANAFQNGYVDQTAHLWSETGALLASSHQVVYYKE